MDLVSVIGEAIGNTNLKEIVGEALEQIAN